MAALPQAVDDLKQNDDMAAANADAGVEVPEHIRPRILKIRDFQFCDDQNQPIALAVQVPLSQLLISPSGARDFRKFNPDEENTELAKSLRTSFDSRLVRTRKLIFFYYLSCFFFFFFSLKL